MRYMCTHARYCYWRAGPLIFIQLAVAYHLAESQSHVAAAVVVVVVVVVVLIHVHTSTFNYTHSVACFSNR